MKTPVEYLANSAARLMIRSYKENCELRNTAYWTDEEKTSFRKQAEALFMQALTKEFITPTEVKDIASEIRNLIANMNTFHSVLHLLSRRLGYASWRAFIMCTNTNGVVPNLNYVSPAELQLQREHKQSMLESEASTIAENQLHKQRRIAGDAQRKQVAAQRKLLSQQPVLLRTDISSARPTAKKPTASVVIPSFLMKEPS